MKIRLHSFFLLALLLLGAVNLVQASRMPEVFAGTITQMSKKLMTLEGPEGTRQFDISKAGVRGWPTKKTCTEVFIRPPVNRLSGHKPIQEAKRSA